MNIWGMQSQSYDDFADRLAPFLDNFVARSHGCHSLPEIVNRIRDARLQVWVCGDFKAVAMTRTTEENVHIDFCSGSDRFDWQDDLHEEVAAWAKHIGRKRLFLMCRPGWSKRAKQVGFREIHRELVRDL
ncbi:putative aminoglycoside acetyltransferase [Paracoccus phage vB_PmaP_KLEP18-1]|nr:putative aminoglycoside acetyltransferase [Paracoccus phage vB_PmaP_KLEP18-1]